LIGAKTRLTLAVVNRKEGLDQQFVFNYFLHFNRPIDLLTPNKKDDGQRQADGPHR